MFAAVSICACVYHWGHGLFLSSLLADPGPVYASRGWLGRLYHALLSTQPVRKTGVEHQAVSPCL